ncbi:hypothetical protein OIU85_006681 [Salix viminalis]|uniref:Serine aminopeptidase S33 domain-containing protein n=1 Tax=Salix viminalis TaxID=40686 RepID=A0A9Q0SVB9_SALVM|nr:hypothetical protein OIU85_006681 [Salix viminalis]
MPNTRSPTIPNTSLTPGVSGSSLNGGRPLPPAETIGCVAVVHGFTGESSWLVQLTSVLFAKHGFVVCAIDHQGHGFSDGLDNLIYHIPDINPVVEDCMQEARGNGLILNGAMCGISAKFKPPWPLEHLLFVVAAVVPTWSVIPTRGSIPDFVVQGGVEAEVGVGLRRWAVPLLVVHGGDDAVCDPASAKELYERAASADKTLKIYSGDVAPADR